MDPRAQQAMLEWIEARRDEIVRFASQLIAIPTENPPGTTYPPCVEVLVGHLESLDLPTERVQLTPDRVAVLSRVGTGRPLVLHGHYDVVPATVPGQFEPVERGGRLYGRGSSDMKAALTSMMVAQAALVGHGFPGAVALVLVPDEETGGQAGTRRLFELNVLDEEPIGAILGEPTSGVIWNASRGAITVRVTVRGEPAHVGLHFQGVNAFETALPILEALGRLKADVRSVHTGFAIEPPEARESILMLGGEVRGGHQFNLVPDAFSFTVERRFNPEEDLERERERLLAVIGTAIPEGAAVEVDVFQEGASSATDEAEPLIGALRAAHRRISGSEPACALCPGLLENRFYTAAGIPAVSYGPGELEVSHGPEESVSVDRLVECAKIYALTALQLAGH